MAFLIFLLCIVVSNVSIIWAVTRYYKKTPVNNKAKQNEQAENKVIEDKEPIKKTGSLTAFAIITLFLSIVFFGLGVFSPLLSVSWQGCFGFGAYDSSIFGIIKKSFHFEDWFLAIVILVFTVVAPITRYVELTMRILQNKTKNILQSIYAWNILDVLLAALLFLNPTKYIYSTTVSTVTGLKIGVIFILTAIMFRTLTMVLITKNKTDKVE